MVPFALLSGYSTGFFRCSSHKYDVNASPPMAMSTRFADSFGVTLTRSSVGLLPSRCVTRLLWPKRGEAAKAHATAKAIKVAATITLRIADCELRIAIGKFLIPAEFQTPNSKFRLHRAPAFCSSAFI